MQVKHMTVIGTGTMGNGIAGQGAMSGFEVILYDIDASRTEAALDTIKRTYDKGVQRGKVSPQDVEDALRRLSKSTELKTAVSKADLVIEAVPESIDLKQSLFAEIEKHAQPSAILATNTSSLSITAIASALNEAGRVVGMHFFNPVAASALVELVKGEYTYPDALKIARTVAEAMGKQCIEVEDFPGFATSRLGIALGNEAMRMYQEGVASAEDIDKAMMLGYKHPIGPLALTDLVGLDVRLAISEHLFKELGTDTFRPPLILKRMVRAGRLGRKTGRGFYEYA